MTSLHPLVDRFGRRQTDLRISVTDRCNLRCRYCIPQTQIHFVRHEDLLHFEEIARFVRIAATLGIQDVRLTGGEPLLRRDVCRLVAMLAETPGLKDLAMTTNGLLLARYAAKLKAAGLHRLNVSLDTLDREKFRRISGLDELPRVLEGIDAAQEAGFRRIKINALAIRGQTEVDVVPLAEFARQRGLALRFIEFMPLGGHGKWTPERVLCGEEVLAILRRHFGPLEPASTNGSTAPATEYVTADQRLQVGLIRSVTEPFCDRCSRLRLMAEGQVKNCLFSTDLRDARCLLRSGAADERIVRLIREAVAAKPRAHGSADGTFATTDRAMHQIGG